LCGPGGLAGRDVPGPGQGRLLHRRRQTGLFFCAYLTYNHFRLAGAVALLDGRIEGIHIDVQDRPPVSTWPRSGLPISNEADPPGGEVQRESWPR
jgi:hypothetical protein